ncbi:hypothetical protein I309_05267 [Cryptococcus deuterogattii LA55]|nr:hypothetical protein I309_05267 [Cryptococcus deuterogattii LA55]KIR91079.1 hypothetical protein I304_05175 [Cryptococcus deuterogattii CBS 10090]
MDQDTQSRFTRGWRKTTSPPAGFFLPSSSLKSTTQPTKLQKWCAFKHSQEASPRRTRQRQPSRHILDGFGDVGGWRTCVLHTRSSGNRPQTCEEEQCLEGSAMISQLFA